MPSSRPRDGTASSSDRSILWRIRRGTPRSLWRSLTPPQLLASSFLLLIAVGTLGFKLLPGLYTGTPLGWLDALFTATSAVCVTGLIVVDTATYFTPAGQAWILLLIQLGGLGIISFTTFVIVALGRRLSLRHEMIAASPADVVPHVDYRRLTRNVFRFTFGIEALGAVALYAFWVPEFGWGGAAWPAVFHAISAFCNAGFSVFSTSLAGYQLAPGILTVVMLLVVVGGLGFLTLEEAYLWQRHLRRRTRFRLSLHSRLVLTTTAVLLLGGWVAFTWYEWHVTLAEMPVWGRLLNGLFASVTTRTAGFNTIDYAQATDGTNFLTIIFMFIGGSPGSTAGGVKTTAVALVGLLAWTRLRGSTHVKAWARTVPEGTVQRAVGLTVLAFALVTAGVFVFSSTEIAPSVDARIESAFLKHLFEVVSAFNTVGLSMGVTDGLSAAGRLTTIVLMFVGRVGMLTLATAIARSQPVAEDLRYAHEDVAVT